MGEENGDRPGRLPVTELRGGDRCRLRQGDGEGSDKGDRQEQGRDALERAAKDEALDAAFEIAELPKLRPRLGQRRPRRHRAQERRSRTYPATSARTTPRCRNGESAAVAVSRSSVTRARLESTPSTVAKFAR